MPPKRARKAADASNSKTKPRAAAARQAQSQPSPSDAEMTEAFRLFAVPRASMTDEEHAQALTADTPDDEADFVRVNDVRRALASLDLPAPPADFFDDSALLVSSDEFVELARTMREMRADDDDEDDLDDEDEEYAAAEKKEKKKRPEQRRAEEIDDAFALFTTPVPAAGRVDLAAARAAGIESKCITIADLRRVARTLREDLDEDTMRAMIEEANGGEGNEGVARGVSREQFEGVMRRAGMFS